MQSRLGWWIAVPLLAGVTPLLVPLHAWQERAATKGQEEREHAGRRQEGEDAPEVLEESVRTRGANVELARQKLDAFHDDAIHPRQWPFLVARDKGVGGSKGAGGSVVGYVEWKPGAGDRVMVADAGVPADPRRRAVHDGFAEIVRPIGVVDSSGRLHVLWTEIVDGVAQLRAARDEGESFAAPVTLTSGPFPSMNVEAVLHADGKLYVAWETGTPGEKGAVRGSRDVYVAELLESGSGLGARFRVGDGKWSDLDPSITSSGGMLWIAWACFTGRDYEIRLRSLEPASGLLSDVIEVSAESASDDLHPSLVAGSSGELWLAWDRIEIPGRGDSVPPQLLPHAGANLIDVSVHVARVEGGRVQVPKSTIEGVADGEVPGAPLQSTGGGVPRLALDAAGRVWIAYRYLQRSGPAARRVSFPVVVQRLDGAGWCDPVEIDHSSGLPEEAAIARDGAGVVVAFQCDRRFEVTSRLDRSRELAAFDTALRGRGICIRPWLGPNGIGVAHAEAEAAAGGAPELVERIARTATPRDHPFGDRLDDPLVTGESHFEVERGGEKWLVFWGNLHCHSSVSRCTRGMEPRPFERWEWGRDVQLCDFMALTDHVGQTDPLEWWELDKLCLLYQSPDFCTLAGWEWSTNQFGHHNVILPGRMAPFVGDDDSIDVLYRKLKPGQCVTIPHHSADVQFPNDFTVVDDRFTRLIEIYQSRRGNYECDGCYKQSLTAGSLGCFAQDALNQGHKFGIIASPDHDYGQCYACVLAKSLDRASIFEALHRRRTYGATAKGMLVDLRVGDAVMGEETKCSAPPKVKLVARGAAELADVVLFRNGRVWKSTRSEKADVGNELTPLRLVVRLPTRAEPPSEAWTLELSSEQARFELLDDRRVFTRRNEAPKWTATRSRATLTWPAGFAPTPGTADYALHVRAADDATIVIKAGGVDASASLSQLERKTARLDAPGGKCAVSVELGDAVVDLAKGLGARDFTAEWEDADLRAGASWYYARVIQVDGEMAWSSPVFVTRE